MVGPKSRKHLAEFEPKSRSDWRKWLQKNKGQKEGVWVIIYKKNSGKINLTVADVVEEALCFGWIDSTPNKLDDLSYKLLLCPRRPKSGWSALNKIRVKKLIAANLMTKDGLEKILIAKKNGSWKKLEPSDRLVIPKELASSLKANKKASAFFAMIAPSSKRGILEWIYSAKTEKTKMKRIEETIRLALKGIRANHYNDLKKLNKG